jgi:HK97 family phage major capsid protein
LNGQRARYTGIILNPTLLNTRKSELLSQQELVLNQAQEAKTKLTDTQEAAFTAATAEIKEIDTTLARMDAIAKSKAQINEPTSNPFIAPTPKAKNNSKVGFSDEYISEFWNHFRNPSKGISMAALGENAPTYVGTDGGYLVPQRTDPTIPALAVNECSARKLSQVIVTDMDLKLPFQATKTVAAAKAESRTSNNPFAGTAPSFNTVTLSAYMAGVQVQATWELLQDVGALESFITADINRGMFNYEENAFVNGSGTGTALGYLNGATDANSAALSINSILDLTGNLKQAYYANASFLMNRQTLIALFKAQIAASQFQNYLSYDSAGAARLLGYPVFFSSSMPTFSAGSPPTGGAVLFGDFAAGWVIGDRGGSGIQAKVLDQVSAVNGVTVILGYRRTDQRCRIQEAVQLMTVTG